MKFPHVQSLKLSLCGWIFTLEKLHLSRYTYFQHSIKIYPGERLLNKLELIQEVKKKCKLNKQEASQVIEIFFSEITSALANGDPGSSKVFKKSSSNTVQAEFTDLIQSNKTTDFLCYFSSFTPYSSVNTISIE
jgi:hypothetical protein